MTSMETNISEPITHAANTSTTINSKKSEIADTTFQDLETIPLVQSQCRSIRLLLAVTRICNVHA